jgi:hypothetical protein
MTPGVELKSAIEERALNSGNGTKGLEIYILW